MTLNKYFRIPSIEAKDLINSGNSNKHYSLLNSDNTYRLNAFSSILDYSLDLIEFINVHKRKREKMGFTIGEYNYTTDIINVEFNHRSNLFEATNGVYIKYGYRFQDITLVDNVYIKDDELIAVKVNTKTIKPANKKLYSPYFTFENKEYKLSKSEAVISIQDLRKELYENGFDIDNVHYVRYKRSAGSSREGTCLFINEKYYRAMMDWSTRGIDKSRIQNNIVSFEAYNALSLSSIEDTIEIDPKNILVVKDMNSTFKENCVAVMKDEELAGDLIARQKEIEITNSIWDGEGLLDESLFKEAKRENSGMMLLRNRFFKCCAFNTKLQKWFKDNNITKISQLNGSTLAESIEDIKFVCTESSVKFLKFGNLSDFRLNVEPTFGIVKSDKKTHFFNGRMVQTNYQILNTIYMNDQDAKDLLKSSQEYRKYINNKEEVLRYHINYKMNMTDYIGEAESKVDLVYSLLGLNNNFSRTSLYKKFRHKLSVSLREKMLRGEILVNGTYATLFGNGYELLQNTIHKFDINNPLLKPGEIMSLRFNDGEQLLGARSPHITMGNLLVSKNVIKDEYNNYFNLTNEIVVVNSINENIMQRLNGCDFDSDTMLLTNNEILVRNAAKMVKEYQVPVCTLIEDRDRSITDLYMIDHLIQNNQIGKIVNLSQYLNSYLFDKNDKTVYKDICILAVLSGMEIDKAKRIYDVQTAKVLTRINNSYLGKGITFRPLFFKGTVYEKTRELPNRYGFKTFNTTMDKIYNSVDKDYSTGRSTSIPIHELIDTSTMVKQGYSSTKAKEVLDIIKVIHSRIQAKWLQYVNASMDEKKIIYNDIQSLYDEASKEIKNSLKNDYTVYLIIKKLDDDKYFKYAWTTLQILFNDKHQTFKRLFENDQNKINYLVETDEENYDIKLYDYYFKTVNHNLGL